MSQTFLGYLADAIVGLHLAYVSYVVLGQAYILIGMVRRWSSIRVRWFRISHLIMIWIVAIEAVVGIACPLTTLENRLRRAAEQPYDERTFVGRCMDRMVFFVDYLPWNSSEVEPAALPADPAPPELDLTLAYVGFALVTTLTYWLAPPRRTTSNKESPGTAVPGLS